MSIWTTFLGWFNQDGMLALDAKFGEVTAEVFYKELAIQSCVNLIANTVARSEFRTYDKGKEVRKDNYYLFNIEPNPNKSASKFWRQVIHNLIHNNEALVVQNEGYFYIAEEFTCKKFAFREYLYSGIVIDGLQLKESKIEPEVLHFELHNEKIRTCIEGLYTSYAKLIATSQKSYKKNNSWRGKVNVPTNYPQTVKAQEELQDLFQNKFRRFFEAENDAVIPLTNGLSYEELKSGGTEGRDIRSFIDDIFDYTAMAFQVPPLLMKGGVADTDNSVSNFLTFCVNPLAELIADEVNRKLYKKEKYLESSYLKVDTSHIRAVDIKHIANALDVLTRIGAYSVDDSLKALGMEPLRTEWSTCRWLTKNYERIEHRHAGETDGVD